MQKSTRPIRQNPVSAPYLKRLGGMLTAATLAFSVGNAQATDWDMPTPHEFQIQAIHRTSFYNDTVMQVIAKTGNGKSIVPLCAATLRRGIAIVMEPTSTSSER